VDQPAGRSARHRSLKAECTKHRPAPTQSLSPRVNSPGYRPEPPSRGQKAAEEQAQRRRQAIPISFDEKDEPSFRWVRTSNSWRWRRDLNPRTVLPVSRFQGECIRPLCHATADQRKGSRRGRASRVWAPTSAQHRSGGSSPRSRRPARVTTGRGSERARRRRRSPSPPAAAFYRRR